MRMAKVRSANEISALNRPRVLFKRVGRLLNEVTVIWFGFKISEVKLKSSGRELQSADQFDYGDFPASGLGRFEPGPLWN